MEKALIGDIGRNCTHDGPGIRTTVFFKGCPMHCPWCHNPEFLSPHPEIAYYRDRCIGCGDCAKICPEGAIVEDGSVRLDRTRCIGCGLCADECPANALKRIGREYNLDELEEIVLRDRLFYASSGGGVTLSGGEPTSQLPFIGPFLARLKQQGIHTAIETNGFFDWESFEASCLGKLDLILFDLKIADPILHKQVTGVSNEVILSNLKKLLDLCPEKIIPRIPIIPGYTATRDNISLLAGLLRDCGAGRCCLLPYHPFGRSKGERVGLVVDQKLRATRMTHSELEQWAALFDGMRVVIE